MERRTAVFSVRPDLAKKLLSGLKQFEFRRVRPALDHGDTVFVYSTAPEMAIVGAFTCGEIVEGAPSTLWRKLGRHSGTSRARFLDYFADKDVAYAIEAVAPISWQRPLPLSAIRARVPRFQPPRSYRFLQPKESLSRVIGMHTANGNGKRRAARPR